MLPQGVCVLWEFLFFPVNLSYVAEKRYFCRRLAGGLPAMMTKRNF